MEAIKKKMQALKLEKENAVDRAEAAEQDAKEARARAEKAEDEIRVLQKTIQNMESDLDRVQEELLQSNIKLEEKDKVLQTAESEVAALNRRIQLLEEDLERSEERLKTATQKLEEASTAADESERIRKGLENRTNMEDDRISLLETQLGQARLIAEESDKKYEEMARRIAMLKADLERAEERASIGESKIVELEEELRVVGNNMKSLEVSEEKAMQKESFETTIRHLTQRLQEQDKMENDQMDISSETCDNEDYEVNLLGSELCIDEKIAQNYTSNYAETLIIMFLHCLIILLIASSLYQNAVPDEESDPYLALESNDREEVVDVDGERNRRFLNFNPFKIFQFPSRRISPFAPNVPYPSLHQPGSGVIPSYSDSGPPHSLSGIRTTLYRYQNTKGIRNNFPAIPVQKAPSYNKPTNFVAERPSYSRVPAASSSSYTPAVLPAPMESGLTPIINGIRSPLASNKVIQQIKPPSLGVAPPHNHQTGPSTHSKNYATKQIGTPLLKVPVEKLNKARKEAQESKISEQSSPFYIPADSSVSSSVSSRIVVNSNAKQPDFLKSSSSRHENQIIPQKPADFNCDGSQDLGWCDLGNTYPKSLVQQLIVQCKDIIEKTHVEIPHNFEKLSDISNFRSELDNASSREARERGNHESWSWASYLHQGSLCEAERGFLRPEAARDNKGVWNVIIQTEQVRQKIPIEMCRNTNNSCKKMLDCGLKSQCLQKYNYHLLLSLDPNDLQDCPTMKLYRFPSACVCHVE